MTPLRERANLDVRLLVPALVAWATTAALIQSPTNLVLGVLGTAVATVPVGFSSRPGCRAIGLIALATATALVGVLGHRAVADAGPIAALAERGSSVRVEAKVASDPMPVRARPGSPPTWRVRLQVNRIDARGSTTRVRTPVLAFGGEEFTALRWHERVVLAGRLQPPQRAGDVVAVLRANRVARVSPAGPAERVVEHLRTGLRTATSGLPADPAGLVPALVIGDTTRMPTRLEDDMRATGMTHLNAVSGSNVTVVLLCIQWLAGALRVPRRYRLVFALVGLGLFVLLCRPEPSVIRAAAMGVVGLLALRSGARKVGAPALAAAVLVLLLVDPHLARSFGFVLSALATLGLLLFARRWADAMARRLPPRLAPLAEATAVPLAAQVFCAPITVLLQSSVSLVGLPANVAAAPLVPIATVAGVLVVCTAPLLPPAAVALAWVAGLPAWGIALIAHVAAALPYGSLPWLPGWPGVVTLVLAILLALTTAPWWLHQLTRRRWSAGAAGITALALVVPVPSPSPPPGWFVAMCDVGQGDATVVRDPGGGVLLVDTGPDPDAVDACLSRLAIGHIDTIVLTHFHADHVDGLSGVLRSGRTVGQVLTTSVDQQDAAGKGEEASRREPTMELIARSRLPVRAVVAGENLVIGSVRARVLWPARTLTDGSVQNNGSVVLDVHAGGARLLFTGDIEREAGAAVRRELVDGRFDVLKVPHHGSANQDAGLIAAVAPRVCLIGVGADNDYGHPAPRTLGLLAGCAVLRTDRDGTILLFGSGDRLRVGAV